jgi:iron complex transport system substrate-binding protein
VPLSPSRKASILLPLLIVPLIALAGCGTPVAQPVPTTSSSSTPTAKPTVDAYEPVTVDNCGVEVTFDEAPERVVTIKSTTTEMLLALGLGDRIVGTAFQDGPVPDKWENEAEDLPVLAEKVPSEEVVLEAEPDLVYAGWESNFSAEGAGTRADLEKLGVNTYVSPSACQSEGQPAKLTFENIFDDIEEIAAIFGVDATKLIDAQRETLDNLAFKAGQDRTALWWSSGSDTPYVGAGIGAPELVMESVGLVNIAEDVDATWAPFNWEAVVDADPDFIILIDAAWNTADHKIEVLEGNPATANLTAVKEGKYLILPFAASEAGIRTVEAASELAYQLDSHAGP